MIGLYFYRHYICSDTCSVDGYFYNGLSDTKILLKQFILQNLFQWKCILYHTKVFFQ
jgi:hypothetical protein